MFQLAIAALVLSASTPMVNNSFHLYDKSGRELFSHDQSAPLELQQIAAIVNAISSVEGSYSFCADQDGKRECSRGVSGRQYGRYIGGAIAGILKLRQLPSRSEVACYSPEYGTDGPERLVLCWKKPLHNSDGTSDISGPSTLSLVSSSFLLADARGNVVSKHEQTVPLEAPQVTAIINAIASVEGGSYAFCAFDEYGGRHCVRGYSGYRNSRLVADVITGILKMRPLPYRSEVSCYAPESPSEGQDQLVLCWRKPVPNPVK